MIVYGCLNGRSLYLTVMNFEERKYCLKVLLMSKPRVQKCLDDAKINLLKFRWLTTYCCTVLLSLGGDWI